MLVIVCKLVLGLWLRVYMNSKNRIAECCSGIRWCRKMLHRELKVSQQPVQGLRGRTSHMKL